MKAVKFDYLDCDTLAGALKGKVEVIELEDLSWKVPHVGYAGAAKSKYESPKSGKTIYVLERSSMYDADAFVTEIWQFEEDFTVEEAREFCEAYDIKRREER